MCKQRAKFVPPTDVTEFWVAPHCAPGHHNPHEICGFCGDEMGSCAKRNGQAAEDGRVECGGSGFWCHGCGRFWAQDACGESDDVGHRACDGAKLTARDGYLWCCCGARLMEELAHDD